MEMMAITARLWPARPNRSRALKSHGRGVEVGSALYHTSHWQPGDPPAPPDKPRIGRATCLAHHGEIWQGVAQGSSGQLRRALVSLPCDLYGSKAIFIPRRSAALLVDTDWRVKARRA